MPQTENQNPSAMDAKADNSNMADVANGPKPADAAQDKQDHTTSAQADPGARINVQIGIAEALMAKNEESCALTVQLAQASIQEIHKILSTKAKVRVDDLSAIIESVDKWISADKDHSKNFQRYMGWEFKELRGQFESYPRLAALRTRAKVMFARKIVSEGELRASLEKLVDRPRMRGQARETVRDLYARTDNPNSMQRAKDNALKALAAKKAEASGQHDMATEPGASSA